AASRSRQLHPLAPHHRGVEAAQDERAAGRRPLRALHPPHLKDADGAQNPDCRRERRRRGSRRAASGGAPEDQLALRRRRARAQRALRPSWWSVSRSGGVGVRTAIQRSRAVGYPPRLTELVIDVAPQQEIKGGSDASWVPSRLGSVESRRKEADAISP